MATKKEIMAKLTELGTKFNPSDKKATLVDLLEATAPTPVDPALKAPITIEREEKRGATEPVKKGNTINLVSKIPKRNTFLSDSVRDERDAEVLRAEAGKREHKGKLKTITTVKHMEVSIDGFWVTEFAIELKE